ncbi:hypothetical protein RP20_CCG002548 [Aedes albopictus]|nr:hypothetical protein RP20_CCG002548 [Aedes albopictus]
MEEFLEEVSEKLLEKSLQLFSVESLESPREYFLEEFLELSIGIENGHLEAYNTDFELQFVHQLKYILGYCRVIVKQEKGKKNSDFLIPKSNSTRPLPITIGNDNVAEIYGPEYGLIYLLKTPQDPLLHIHLYECEKYEQVSLYITHHISKLTYEDMKKR